MKPSVGVVWFCLIFLGISNLAFAGSEGVPEKMKSRFIFVTSSPKGENFKESGSQKSPANSEEAVQTPPPLAAVSENAGKPGRRFHPEVYLGALSALACTVFLLRRKNKVLSNVEEEEQW